MCCVASRLRNQASFRRISGCCANSENVPEMFRPELIIKMFINVTRRSVEEEDYAN